jgi:hypothetical protein
MKQPEQMPKIDPVHGKIIKTLAVETKDFTVFIDSNNEIFYHTSASYNGFPKDFNKLNSKIRRLEILVLSNLSDRDQANYNFLLANNLAESLEELNIERAWDDLQNIENDICLIVNNTQKKSFSYGTNIALLVIVSLIVLSHLNKDNLIYSIGGNPYAIFFCSLFGGIGALIFNYSRSKTFVSNRVIGRFYHFLEGSLRIFYGVIYALIIILGVKSGVILNFFNNANSSLCLFAFIGILSGASDTFITGILKSLEKKSHEEE